MWKPKYVTDGPELEWFYENVKKCTETGRFVVEMAARSSDDGSEILSSTRIFFDQEGWYMRIGDEEVGMAWPDVRAFTDLLYAAKRVMAFEVKSKKEEAKQKQQAESAAEKKSDRLQRARDRRKDIGDRVALAKQIRAQKKAERDAKRKA